MYYSIIGDIIESRLLPNRYDVQQKLRTILKRINRKYSKNIASTFSITLGDEFQGFLYTPNGMFEIIHEIRYNLYPVEIRFGIGFGNLNTSLRRKNSLGMDGSAWYEARESIEAIKKRNEKQKLFKEPSIRIEIEGENKHITNLINASLGLADLIEESWTHRQREVAYSTILEYGFSTNFKQKDIAQFYRVTPASINKLLKNSDLYYYLNLFDKIEMFLYERGKFL